METAKHTLGPCKQIGGIEQHYSNKNWSDKFVCIECGSSRRFSLNFLGNRRVPMCDGQKIIAGEKMDFKSWCALKNLAQGG